MWSYILVFFFGVFWASLGWVLTIRHFKKVQDKAFFEMLGGRGNGRGLFSDCSDTSADHIGTVRDCSTCAHFVRDERGYEVCDNDGSCDWKEKGSEDNEESS